MAAMNKLTDRGIRSQMLALKHRDTPVKLFDGGGLYLLVKPPKKSTHQPGPAYWRLKYRVAGVEKLISLGVYPEVTLAKARERRDEERSVLLEGKDPSRERKAERARQRAAIKNTFRAVAEEWLDLHPKWAPAIGERL